MRHDGDRRQRRPGGGHRAAGRRRSGGARPVGLRRRVRRGRPRHVRLRRGHDRAVPQPARTVARSADGRAAASAPSTFRCRSSTTRGRSRWPRHASARRPVRRRRRASSSGPASAAASSSTAGCTSVVTAGPASWPTRSSCATARRVGVATGAASRLWRPRGRWPRSLQQPTIEDVFQAAAAGDQRAAQAIETVADHLGVAIANVITMLVPERVVIGGGVAGAGTDLLEPIRRAVARHSVLVPADWYEIVPAVLGPYAGAIGAALVGFRSRRLIMAGGAGGGGSAGAPRPAIDPACPVDRQQAGCRRRRRFELASQPPVAKRNGSRR